MSHTPEHQIHDEQALKAIFDKTGASTRGALVAQLFFKQDLDALTAARSERPPAHGAR
jgi:hypothetical protein